MTATGGFGTPYTITWSTGQTTTGNQDYIIDNPIADKNYTVTVSDACETTPLVMSTNISVAPLPVPMISVDANEKCEPAYFVITNQTNPAMTGNLTWNISNGQTFNNMDQVVTDTMSDGFYDVQLIVTSPNGCIDSVTWNDYLVSKPKPEADFRFSPTIIKMFNTQVHFTNYTLNAVNYEWFIDQGNPAYSNLDSPSTLFPDGVTGNYEVTLIAESDFGCLDTTKQTVIVYPEVLIYAPNTFTPDGDEHNQDWGIYIEGIDPYDFTLLIFNRWGEVIWESHDPKGRWDGTYNGTVLKEGIYIWKIETKDLLNDGKYEFKGFINIIR
jgi:gliding motility-associated-like protein